MNASNDVRKNLALKAAFVGSPATIETVYGQQRREEVARQAELLPEIISADSLDAQIDRLAETEVFFSTWGMPRLRPDQMDRLPNLRVVFYAAGSVQGFARPLLERGIVVTSAWQANAVPVAEYTLAQILLAGKGYWRNLRDYDGSPGSYGSAFRGPGNYGETISLLGAGSIGRAVIGLLRPFRLKVIVYDPFLTVAEAQQLGVEQVSLEDAFARGLVVSNHLADKAETAGLIGSFLLGRLRSGATFINTGRGRTVVEPELAETLHLRPDLTALLDVTSPEPMLADSPLRRLPNVHVTTHIAGAVSAEVERLADSAIEEFGRYRCGESLHHAVTLSMLDTMA